MSAPTPGPCNAVRGVHEGPVRFYRGGWLCDVHANPEPSGPEQQTAADHNTT